MAIYHASMRMLSRSDRNTVQALAYRTGTDLYDEKTGQWFYYSHKNVDHVDLLLPEDAPQWFHDLKQEISRDRTSAVQKISNLAERAEKRKNSQVYREFEFSLPRELTKEQNIKLAKEFLQDQACQLGMVAIPSFHFEVDEETGEENPHCHALMLTRRLSEDGLSLTKERDWNRTEVVLTWREQLAGYINFHLKMHGHNVRVDHRSYKDQGLDILPQPKLARGMKAMESRIKVPFKQRGKTGQEQMLDRRAAYEKVREHNVARLIRRPETVFDIVTRGCSTFMWGDVEKVLARYVREQAIYDRLRVQLQQSRELVLLREQRGVSESGEREDTSIYTTRSMLKSELSLVRLAEKLGGCQRHLIAEQKVDRAIEETNKHLSSQGHELSLDQVRAIRHVTRGDQLSCVVGYAGAGKSTMFKTVKEVWQTSGYQVYGLAPTGRAAQNLEEIGISSQTLHKFLKDYEEGRCRYRSKSVLILDEAGMVDVRRFHELLQAVDHLGVKLVVSGDGAQAQPIEAGPGFRLVTDRLGVQKLDTVIRQQVDWQQEATRLFGTYQTQDALNFYLEKGHVKFVEEKVSDLEDFVARGHHKSVVILYNLSRRMAGNVWHSMLEDMKKQELSSENWLHKVQDHEDYALFKHWQGIRKSVSQEMIVSMDTYRNLMSQQGVDPTSFASQFVPHDLSSEDKALRVQELIKDWRLQAPDSEQALHPCDPRHQTRKQLIEAWTSSRKDHPEKSHLIVTYTNRDTALLNQDARASMRLQGKLAIEEHIHTIRRESRDDFGQKVIRTEQKAFAQGERVVFTRNDKSLRVRNGTLGTLEEINSHTLKVRIDGQGEEKGRVVSFASKLYPYFDQGWAMTIIKSQGSTADHVFKLATHEEDRNLAYVGMTRHRESLQVFGSQLDFWRDQIFKDRLSQSREKLSSLDYVSQEEAQSRIQPPARLKEALATLGNRLESWGYTTHKSWRRLSEIFTGERVQQEDRLVVLPRTMDEVQRSRDMGLMMAPQSSSPSVNPTFHSGLGRPGFGSGHDQGTSSGSVVLREDITSFIDQQATQDALRDGRVSGEDLKEDRPESLKSKNIEVIKSDVKAPALEPIQSPQHQEILSVSQMLFKDLKEEQVVTTKAPGAESAEAEQETTVRRTPEQQQLNREFEAIREYLNIRGEKTELFERQYHILPQETVDFQKKLRKDEPTFKQHLQVREHLHREFEAIREYLNIRGEKTELFERQYQKLPQETVDFQKKLRKDEPTFKQHLQVREHLHREFETIREYLNIRGEKTELFERQYHILPQETVEYQKHLRRHDDQFTQHMTSLKNPDLLSSPVFKDQERLEIKKADDLIQTIYKVEQISRNFFSGTLQRQAEAMEQLEVLYTKASVNPVVMEKLKEKDPELQVRIQDHVESQRTRTQGLEM